MTLRLYNVIIIYLLLIGSSTLKNYSISLPSYSIGDNVYDKICEICLPFGKKAICIGDKTAIIKVKDLIIKACCGSELKILDFLWYGGDAYI